MLTSPWLQFWIIKNLLISLLFTNPAGVVGSAGLALRTHYVEGHHALCVAVIANYVDLYILVFLWHRGVRYFKVHVALYLLGINYRLPAYWTHYICSRVISEALGVDGMATPHEEGSLPRLEEVVHADSTVVIKGFVPAFVAIPKPNAQTATTAIAMEEIFSASNSILSMIDLIAPLTDTFCTYHSGIFSSLSSCRPTVCTRRSNTLRILFHN